MTLTRRILALLTLSLWWPATIHCGLEAVSGVEWFGCASADAESESCAPGACEDDACAIVEGGQYRPSYEVFDVGPPVSWLCECLVCEATLPAPRVAPGVPIDPARTAAPPWVRSWQFERRAAPAPRAPSSIA